MATKSAYTRQPRPAVIVQADIFSREHASVTLGPITSECIDAALFSVTVPPGDRSGLTAPSQVMVDKLVSVPRLAIHRVVGRCSDDEVGALSDAVRGWLAALRSPSIDRSSATVIVSYDRYIHAVSAQPQIG